MKQIKTAMLLIVMFAFASCKAGLSTDIPVGRYVRSGQIKAEIVIYENKLELINLDLSDMEADVYEAFLINKATESKGSPLSETETKAIIDAVDLEAQFSGKQHTFEAIAEESAGCVGIYVPVANTELYLYLQYYQNNKSIVLNDVIYFLEGSETK